MDKEVFISYKSDEFDDANWVRSILEQNGITCWMAPSCIPGGSSYALEIPKAIKGCKVFVLILSKKSQESKWVPKELDQAINEGKIIMPFMIENCSLKDDFNFYLSNIQRYCAYENKVSAMRNMISEICAILGRPVPSAPEEKPQAPEDAEQTNEVADSAEPSETLKEETADLTPDTEKPRKTKPEKKQKQKAKKEKSGKKSTKKKILISIVAIFAVIILLQVIITILSSRTVTVAGDEIYPSTSGIEFENAEFTQEDVEIISDLELTTIKFKSCTFPDSMYDVFENENMWYLTLSDCNIDDEKLALIDFSAMPNLSRLDISNNEGITDLSGLMYAAEFLDELNISGTSVSDISTVASFTNLTALNISDLGLSDISAIKNMSNLSSLDISNNKLETLDAVSSLIYLSSLSAANNPLKSFDGVNNLTQLYSLDMSNTGISDITFISKSENCITELYLADNNIDSLDALSNANKLRTLIIDNNNVTTLEPLKNIPALETLSAKSNKLTYFNILTAASQLSDIDVSDNEIAGTVDLSFIKNEENNYLSLNVDISGNSAVDQIILPSVQFNNLDISGTGITDLSAIPAEYISKLTVNYSEETDYSALESSNIYELILIGCPLDKQVNLAQSLDISINFVSEESVTA